MYRIRSIAMLLAGLALSFSTLPTAAQETSTAEAAPAYSEAGADACLKCHDEDSKFPVLNIFKTKHARKDDARTPFAHLQCETCHGPGAEHGKRLRRGQERPPIRNFGKKGNVPVAEQNRVCIDCHSGDGRLAWPGSKHQREEVACTDCHQVHVTADPVMVKREQPQVCYDCHRQTRTEFMKPSAHPVDEGVIACSGCHESHGSAGHDLLAQTGTNQTCFRCHAEKRGPFLWEHAPAAEDCSTCHTPHGSVQPALLSKRAPLLCQECHSQAGHPSLAFSGDGLPDGSPSRFLLARSCLNCHTQVHGSNHPSGVKLMR